MILFPARCYPVTLLTTALLAVAAGPIQADAPRVRQLRLQKVGNTTYFHVRFNLPDDARLPEMRNQLGWWRSSRPDWARLPRLVPQDGAAQAVYLHLDFGLETEGNPGMAVPPPIPAGAAVPPPPPIPPGAAPVPGAPLPNSNSFRTPAVPMLEFSGKVRKMASAKFLLLYPTLKETTKDSKNTKELVKSFRSQGGWGEVAVVLNFNRAKTVLLPAGGFQRQPSQWPAENDLEGRWAAAQAGQFAVNEALTPEAGFYGFARETTGRKYRVPAPGVPRPTGLDNRLFETRRAYELTTGASAIAESLALNRLRNPNFRDKDPRSVDIANVAGINIAQHPWIKMMAGKKPSPEPLARLVPHDNYYLHFKSIRKFIEAADLMDQWGTTLIRAFEINSRDYHLQERLERQLCLKSGGLARVLGPAVVRSLAITGSDPYLREGSDVSVIFDVVERAAFLAAVEPFLLEAKKTFAGQLRHSKREHRSITIESFETPLREVSLHRAAFGEYVAYSNSPVGLRRILDTYRGTIKPLDAALDFQYLRTVFRLEDPREDGFLFLSDAFIRNLVGPALRIKERRRLDGLTSLSMITHGALFTGWETGKLPLHHNHLLAVTGLSQEEMFSPEGNSAFWDAEKQIALSPAYNTLNFATPLIELPMDKVTPTEQKEYEEFRLQYLGLWRQYFDPIGMRIALDDKKVRWETYILPLVKNSAYDNLRQLVGGGTITRSVMTTAIETDKNVRPTTLVEFMGHLSPQANRDLGRLISKLSPDIPGLNWIGDWFMVRLDDSPIYAKMVESAIRGEFDRNMDPNENIGLLFQVPLTAGVQVRNPLVFAGVLAASKKALGEVLPNAIDWDPMHPPYKGTTIVRIRAKNLFTVWGREPKPGEIINPTLYYAFFNDCWFISLRVEPIKDLIDRAMSGKDGQRPKNSAQAKVNAALRLAPAAALRARDFLRFYLEWETHRRTLSNNTLLYALYRSGAVGADQSGEWVQKAAMKYLGFMPTSADLAPFTYESKTDEIVNLRHGSLRRPMLHAGIQPDSPLGRLLDQFHSIHAELTFREDGINTVVTLQKQEAPPK